MDRGVNVMFDKRVIIVDDFYPQPLDIREMALDADYESMDNARNYPGVNTTQSFWNSQLQAMLSSITGDAVYATPTSSCGHFRSTCAHDTSKQIIHFDPKLDQVWAGVIYLSLPQHYEGHDAGTRMYRHKRSGMTVAPIDHVQASAMGVRTQQDMVTFFETEGMDESLWQVELEVPIRFNRLVLFRPWMWHGIAGHFGDTIINSRLTQLIFLNSYG